MSEASRCQGLNLVHESTPAGRIQAHLLGRKGEDIALNYLTAKGYKLIERNWHLGRSSEIDLVFKGEPRFPDLFIFVEVKTRYREDYFGFYDMGFNAVYKTKQQKVVKAALLFLALNGLADAPSRFDVVVVEYPRPADSLNSFLATEPVVIHVEGAF